VDNAAQLSLISLLLLAAIYDVSSNRIPNYCVLAIVVLGISSQILKHGFTGFTGSIGGLFLGLVCFLPFYIKKGMGAGDVKLMAAVGSFLGATLTLLAVAYTLIFGGLFAAILVLIKGNSRSMLTRYFLMSKVIYASGKLIYFPPGSNEPSEIRFAYATAIAAGTFSVLYQHYAIDIDALLQLASG